MITYHCESCSATCDAPIPDAVEPQCGWIWMVEKSGVGYLESGGRFFCSWACVAHWAIAKTAQLREVS